MSDVTLTDSSVVISRFRLLSKKFYLFPTILYPIRKEICDIQGVPDLPRLTADFWPIRLFEIRAINFENRIDAWKHLHCHIMCYAWAREFRTISLVNFKYFLFKNYYNLGILVLEFSFQNNLRSLLLMSVTVSLGHPVFFVWW